MNCKRGDVVLVRFPNSNLVTYKKRPALVVQADGLSTGLNQKILALVTSKTSRSGPTRVFVAKSSNEGTQMGVLQDSVVVTDNLATVLDREMDKVIGHLPNMAKVDQALRTSLAL